MDKGADGQKKEYTETPSAVMETEARGIGNGDAAYYFGGELVTTSGAINSRLLAVSACL